MKYNIGDLFVIPFVEKIGIIIDIKNEDRFPVIIFWQYKSGETETVSVDEKTLNLWLDKKETRVRNNLYYPVPK